jgi:4-hydroxythreonine-4-phosphate dehydrogenase
MNIRLGITLGDVSGIGPEIVAKMLYQRKREEGVSFMVLGPQRALEHWRLRLATERAASEQDAVGAWPDATVEGVGVEATAADAQGSLPTAHAALAALREGARRCLGGELDGVVTAPVNKAAMLRTGAAFTGQTEYLADVAGARDVAMMLLGADDRGRWLRVALATTHLPLCRVPSSLTADSIRRAVRLASRACADLELPRARVGVCGLNPHAGEEGALGGEEIALIQPTVAALRTEGWDVAGPFPADTLFYEAYRGDYEAVVAMYHDQGLAPLKMIGFECGVNWTLGLPFVRTSPDHGTAYNIAGKGAAHASSMMAAVDLAVRLCRRCKG